MAIHARGGPQQGRDDRGRNDGRKNEVAFKTRTATSIAHRTDGDPAQGRKRTDAQSEGSAELHNTHLNLPNICAALAR
jgi:hypothetical protein